MYSWCPPDVLNIWRMFSKSGFSIEIERILSSCSPTCIMISLRCTEHPPMYWTSPDVLMISPRCTHGIPLMYWTSPDIHYDIPLMYWTSPDVLMVSPRCTHDILPMYWTPSNVLNTPRCTKHPPMYWTPPDVLNISPLPMYWTSPLSRCTEHTLYRVFIWNSFKFFFQENFWGERRLGGGSFPLSSPVDRILLGYAILGRLS